MTWKLLQLAFPLVFVGIAAYLYGTKHALLVGFREQLGVSPKGRRFVVLVALLMLLAYHFTALCASAHPVQLLPSSLLVFALFSEKYSDGIMRLLHRKGFMWLCYVMMLAAFFLPIANPLAVTLMVLLVTSWVYPTKDLMAMVTERGDTSDIIEDTIEGLRAEMVNIHTPYDFEEAEVIEVETDVDTVPAEEDASQTQEVEIVVNDDASSSGQPSERAIRNQKQREKDRERRQNRKKRRARRAKNGH